MGEGDSRGGSNVLPKFVEKTGSSENICSQPMLGRLEWYICELVVWDDVECLYRIDESLLELR